MDYGELIKSAFWISWRNRYLWFFGFFAGASVPSFQGSVPTGGPDESGGDAPSGIEAPAIDTSLLIGIGVAALIVLLIFIALSLISQGALIETVAAADRGERRGFGQAWRSGTANCWRVLRLGLLLLVISLVALIVIVAPTGGIIYGVFQATEALGARIAAAFVLGLIGILALIVFFIVLTIVAALAYRNLVLARGGARESLRVGYRWFRARLGTVLLIWLLAVGLGLGALIAFFAAFLLVGLVLALPAIGLFAGGLETAGLVAAIAAGVMVLVLSLIAAGALGTFQHAYWTLAYLRLTALPTGPPGAAAASGVPPPAPA